jgi:KDO2-lipid IV(A) lauroyltransferase
MFFVRLFSKLPFWILYRISDLAFLLLFYVFRYRRRIVRDNLQGCFPSMGVHEIVGIERKFYKNLCDFPLETLKLLTMNKEELLRRTRFQNADALRQYKDNGINVVMLAAHTFNWEWMLAAGSLELPMQVDFVYQPQRSAFANELSLKTRTRFGAYAIEREKVGRESLKRKNITKCIATVADQFPGHSNHRRHWTKFMGRDTAFFYGVAQLAILNQSPVFFSEIIRKGRGKFEVTLKKISEIPATEEDSLRMLDSYARETERLIREQPDNWLWSHNRWKVLDPEDQPSRNWR